MEKNIYLQCEKEHSEQTLQQRLNGVRALLSKPICLFASYYSAVLGREISMRQTLLLLNAQACFRVYRDACRCSSYRSCSLLCVVSESCHRLSQGTLEHRRYALDRCNEAIDFISRIVKRKTCT